MPTTLPPLNHAVVASAAAVLDARKIPFVLWGNFLLTIFSVPTIVDGIDFVISDPYLDLALESLRQANLFKECVSPETCLYTKLLLYAPTPDCHLHITETEYVRLYSKSSTLWKISDLCAVDGENVILASDTSRLPGPDVAGKGGRFPGGLHPVRVPSVYRSLQAFLLLVRRGEYATYWMSKVVYILEYCTDKGVFDVERLSGNERVIVEAMFAGDREKEDRAFAALD